MQKPVVIVGGGLAGLCCARGLTERKIPFMLLESKDRFGGRVRTESVEGFQLDVGFQVLLTSYPEAAEILDYKRLRLGRFEPGALVRCEGKFHRFADPWRQPKQLISTAVAPIGSLRDKLRVGSLRADVLRGDPDDLLDRPEISTLDRLCQYGFSSGMIQRFFRPFFSGVFLEKELSTSSRKFDYLFRLFSSGQAALPTGGMRQIVEQLAEPLARDSIRLNASVTSVFGDGVQMDSGEQIAASRVVIAVDAWNAAKLLGNSALPHGHHVAVIYFAARRPPVKNPVLVLNGEESGPVNSLCVPSQVAEKYAPAGQSLVSVSVLLEVDSGGRINQPVESEVLEQLESWFGPEVRQWRHLKSYTVLNALPAQPRIDRPPARQTVREDGIVVCGDYTDVASIQGAMRSGRLAALAVSEHFSM